MVIKIPSKDIYQIDNQKVIDNQVDKIEIQQKVVSPDNQYGTSVYNAKFEAQELENPSTNKSSGNGAASAGTLFVDGKPNTWNFGAGVKIVDTYYTITVRIPKQQGNSIVNKILTGKRDDTGEPFIGLYKMFTEKVYYDEVPNCFVSGDYSPIGATAPNAFDFTACENYNFTNLIQENNIVDLTNRQVIFTLSGENKDSNDLVIDWGTPTISSPSNMVLQSSGIWTIESQSASPSVGTFEETFTPQESDLSAITYKDEDDEYVFYDIKLLFLRTMYACCSAVLMAVPITIGNKYPAKVVKFEQIVNQVQVTVYGNTLGISMQDNTISIGNGENIVSFNSNELMQSTNSPTVEETYQKVIDEWKNGKETAVLKCAIDDYYIDIPKEINVTCQGYSISGNIRRVLFTPNDTNDTVEIGDILRQANGAEFTVTSIATPYIYTSTALSTMLPNIGENVSLLVVGKTAQQKVISTSGENGLPMSIHIGDIVEPYVHSNKGDIPMSYYEDNSPKQFVVIGKGIQAKGRVFQKLTLQEKIKDL